jgi:hypothetical protein
MIALAVTAAGFSWYWNVRTTQHCLQFWGPEAALRIASSPKAELLRLEAAHPTEADAAVGAKASVPISAGQRVDVSQARGFGNVRRLLVQDRSFNWSAEPPATAPAWTFALRFDDAKAASLVLLAPESGVVALDGRPGTAAMDPAAAKILAEFAAEQFAAGASSPAASVR